MHVVNTSFIPVTAWSSEHYSFPCPSTDLAVDTEHHHEEEEEEEEEELGECEYHNQVYISGQVQTHYVGR